MLKIDLGKQKTLEFEISLVGKFTGDPHAEFKINFDSFSIGFPAKISSYEKIVVELPKIIDFLNTNNLNTKKCIASLLITSEKEVFNAWQDEVKITYTEIKATLKEKEIKEEVKQEVKAVLKEEVVPEKPVIKPAVNLIEGFQPNTSALRSVIKNKVTAVKKEENADKILDALKNAAI